MNFQVEQEELLQRVVAALKNITDRPDGWLPHTVFVEEEGVDSFNFGGPTYNQYKLLDFNSDGECQLQNVITNEVEERNLPEIELSWLIMVHHYYGEVKENCIKEEYSKELKVFVFPIELNRNISDTELIEHWNQGNVQAYTPDEFAALLNDEMFDDTNNYIRFINI